MNSSHVRIAVFLGALLTACGGAQTGAHSGGGAQTIAVTDLPVGASISEAYRFALRPTPEWQIAREEELTRFGGIAAGGAFRTDGGGYGVVVVESVPGMDLERAAALTVNAFPEEARALRDQRATRFLGYPAVRQVISGRIEGMPVEWTNIIFIHQAHLYRITAWGAQLDARGVESFFESFALLEGDVVRPPREAVQNAEGNDWRVHDGIFESLAANLTVRSENGWRVVVGEDLVEVHAGAAIGLVSDEPDVYAVVLSERVPEARYESLAQHLASTTSANLGGRTYGSRTLPFAGAEIELSVYRANGFEYLFGVHCDDGRCQQLLAWYVEGSAEAATAAFQRMPRIEPLDGAARAECERALASSVRERRRAGAGYAYRGHAYVDFRRGLTLRTPEGSYWEMSRQAEPGAESNAELNFRDSVHGVHGLFLSEALNPGVNEATYHREVRAATGLPESRASRVRLGGAPGHESAGPRDVAFGTFEFRIFTTVINDRGYRFSFWGWPEHLRAASEHIDALIRTATLHGGPIPAHTLENDRLADHRFGMSMRIPTGGEYTDFTQPDARGISVVHGFGYGDGSIIQVVAARSHGGDAQMRSGFVRRMIGRMRDRVGPGVEPQESESTLAGRPASMVRWTGGMPIELRVIAIDEIVYAIVVIGRNDMARIAEGFELLD